VKRRRLLHGLGLLVLLAVVLPFVIYAVPGVLGAEHSYVILSGSMEPELSPGDAVIVAESDPAEIEDGDVITFRRDGGETVITHRVVEVQTDDGQRSFVTKGDANEDPDRQPVPASDVVGTVELTIPMIGYVVHFVNTPLGFVALVLLPLGTLAVTEAWSVAKRTRVDVDAEDDASAQPATQNPDPPTATPPTRAQAGEATLTDSPAMDSTAIEGADWTNRSDDTASTPGIPIGTTDLVGTFLVLAVLTPYTIHVALTLQTLLAFTVAYAVGFTALALGTLEALLLYRASIADEQPATEEPPGSKTDGAAESTRDQSGSEQPAPGLPNAEPPVRREEIDD